MINTYLSREDVKQAYMVAMLMSDFDNMMRVLHQELDERIIFNKKAEREAKAKKWIAQEKRERTTERNKSRKHNEALDKKKEAGEYVDINDYWFTSPPPHAMSCYGVTICGWCLKRDGEPLPKEGCFRHYWNRENRPRK